MTLLQSIILSIVQGITEFLPVSSSAHLLIASKILQFPVQSLFFDVMLHLGTLGAVCIYFRRVWWALLVSGFRLLRGQTDEYTPILWCVIVGTVPMVIFGTILTTFHIQFRDYDILACNMIVFGVFLWATDRWMPRLRILKDMTLKDAWIIGLFQAIALLPGVSRSGACLTAARLLKMDRVEAARFAMMISVPAVIAATIKTGLDAYKKGTMIWDYHLWVGIGLTFVIGYFTIHWVLKWLGRYSLAPFAIYRVILGILLLMWL